MGPRFEISFPSVGFLAGVADVLKIFSWGA